MCLLNKESKTLMLAGMAALALGNLAQVAHRLTHVITENTADFAQGFFLAIAIGLLALSTRARRTLV
ncbi:MAG: hypothetical protein DMF59_02310 [Acidobacteria bacterium]|nr:MAG: hypothetical protein DMF59_02310 [Acidobacteriota bacterium]